MVLLWTLGEYVGLVLNIKNQVIYYILERMGRNCSIVDRRESKQYHNQIIRLYMFN